MEFKDVYEKCFLKGILKDATMSDRDGIRRKQNINTCNRMIVVSAIFFIVSLVYLINDLITDFYQYKYSIYNMWAVIIMLVSSFLVLIYSIFTKLRDDNLNQMIAAIYTLLIVLGMDLFLVSDLFVGRGDYLIVFYNFILVSLVPIYSFPISIGIDVLTLLGVYLPIGLLHPGNVFDAYKQSTLILLSVMVAKQYLRVVKTKGLYQQIKLENVSKELEVISTIDFLTKLSNRTGLDHFLNHEVAEAINDERPISITMLDIDDFKSYNDYYSHMTGDSCLRRIGLELQRLSLDKFHAFRYGGEEFLVVGIDCSEDELDRLNNDILNGIRRLNIDRSEVESVEPFVTVSLGSARGTIKSLADFMILLKLADNRLYISKKTGKNKITKES